MLSGTGATASRTSAARERVFLGKGDNTRLAGKMQYHYRLAFDGEGLPMLYAFRTCRHFIRTSPALVYDSGPGGGRGYPGEDHAYDEGRYVC